MIWLLKCVRNHNEIKILANSKPQFPGSVSVTAQLDPDELVSIPSDAITGNLQMKQRLF
jgi:hypothetical protein